MRSTRRILLSEVKTCEGGEFLRNRFSLAIESRIIFDDHLVVQQLQQLWAQHLLELIANPNQPVASESTLAHFTKRVTCGLPMVGQNTQAAPSSLATFAVVDSLG